jgi:hypothetical protein
MKKLNYEYWLDWGTLLGAYREHDFIPYDDDLDVGLWLDKIDLNVLQKELEANNILLKKAVKFYDVDKKVYPGFLFLYKNVALDLFFYTLNENIALTHSDGMVDGVNYSIKNKKLPVIFEEYKYPYKGLKEYSFLGRAFFVPENTEEWLICDYGKSFMTPIKTKDYQSCVTNMTRYSQMERQAFMTIIR